MPIIRVYVDVLLCQLCSLRIFSHHCKTATDWEFHLNGYVIGVQKVVASNLVTAIWQTGRFIQSDVAPFKRA